jgi:streptogramin lyase
MRLKSVHKGGRGARVSVRAGAVTCIGRLVTAACVVSLLFGATTAREQPRAGARALPNVAPAGIILGPDHNLWFIEKGAIGRVSPVGVITSFAIAHHSGDLPSALTVGPDGALWFLLPDTVGRVTTAGAISTATISILPGWQMGDPNTIRDLIVGPDKRLWFISKDDTGYHYLMSLTISPQAHPTAGALPLTLQQALTSGYVNTDKAIDPSGIAAGRDGTVWFVEYEDNPAFPLNIIIGRIDAAKRVRLLPISLTALFGRYSRHPEQGCRKGVCLPEDLTQTADGAVWFTMLVPLIGQVAPSGRVSGFLERPVPGKSANLCKQGIPALITHDRENNIWYGELSVACIGRLTPKGVITTLVSPHRLDNIDGLVADAQGNIWFTLECVNSVGRLAPNGHVSIYHIPHTALDAGTGCPVTL